MYKSKVLILLLAAVALAACGGGDGGSTSSGDGGGSDNGSEAGGGGSEVTVTAANFAFSPDELSVEPGEEVSISFVNDDTAPHTMSSEDLGLDIKADAGETATGTFTAPDSGSVDFQCNIHPAMKGTISVGGGSAKGVSGDKEDKEKEDGEGGMYDY